MEIPELPITTVLSFQLQAAGSLHLSSVHVKSSIVILRVLLEKKINK